METIIITGSSGFIGYSLAKYLLKKKYKIIGIDLHDGKGEQRILQNQRLKQLEVFRDFTYIRKDLSEDISDLKEYFDKSNSVIHLAATPGVRESNIQPHKYIRNNIVAFSNVIEMSIKSNIGHFVFASSSSVYGNLDIPKGGLKENMIGETVQSIYAMTKKINEMEAEIISKRTSMQITGFRFFSVYGPYGRPDMAVWRFADSILNDKYVKVFGDGLIKRDFTYIDDVVFCIEKAIRNKRASSYEIYNIGCSRPVTLSALIRCIESEIGRKANIVYLEKESADVDETFANMEKYVTDYEIDEKHIFTPLEKGVAIFCEWLTVFRQ